MMCLIVFAGTVAAAILVFELMNVQSLRTSDAL